MGFNKRKPEAEMLEQYRVALENAKNQPAIATVLSEFGYDAATMAAGTTLLTDTRTAYDFNKTEDDETKEAYATFSNLQQEIATAFLLHRKKAKVVFRKDKLTAEKLGITGSVPKSYVRWLEKVKKFYSVAPEEAVIAKLSKLKITAEDVTSAKTSILQLEHARSEYLREKGESQDATKAKDTAFAEIDDWMQEFYAVAKIALEDNPQLLEALGIIVRS